MVWTMDCSGTVDERRVRPQTRDVMTDEAAEVGRCRRATDFERQHGLLVRDPLSAKCFAVTGFYVNTFHDRPIGHTLHVQVAYHPLQNIPKNNIQTLLL